MRKTQSKLGLAFGLASLAGFLVLSFIIPSVQCVPPTTVLAYCCWLVLGLSMGLAIASTLRTKLGWIFLIPPFFVAVGFLVERYKVQF